MKRCAQRRPSRRLPGARRALRGSAEVGPMSVVDGEKPRSGATRSGASGRAPRTVKDSEPCTAGRNLARLLRRRRKSSDAVITPPGVGRASVAFLFELPTSTGSIRNTSAPDLPTYLQPPADRRASTYLPTPNVPVLYMYMYDKQQQQMTPSGLRDLVADLAIASSPRHHRRWRT